MPTKSRHITTHAPKINQTKHINRGPQLNQIEVCGGRLNNNTIHYPQFDKARINKTHGH